LEEIARYSGSQFDPELAVCFIQALGKGASLPVLPQTLLPALTKYRR